VERYRLLNEPRLAESICLDIIAVEPDNQEALVALVLALSEQLERRQTAGVQQAQEYIARLDSEYKRAYYNGIVAERRGHVVLRLGRPRYTHYAYNWYHTALEYYAEAEKVRPEGNDDVILRWNTVVRTLDRHPELVAEPDEASMEQLLE
jgi:hypothetical protein